MSSATQKTLSTDHYDLLIFPAAQVALLSANPGYVSELLVYIIAHINNEI